MAATNKQTKDDMVEKTVSNKVAQGQNDVSCPSKDDGISAVNSLQQTMSLMLEKLNHISLQNEEIRKAVFDKGGVNERLDTAEENIEQNMSQIIELKNENTALRKELGLVKGILIKVEQKLENHDRSILDHTTRSMQDNLLFFNMPETEDEDLILVIHRFLKEKLAYDEGNLPEIINIHRIQGPPNQNKPIVCRFLRQKDKSHILKSMRERFPNAGKNDIRVASQLPEEVREKRRTLYEMQKKYKENNTETKIIKDKLVFTGSGTVYRPKLTAPKLQDLFEPTEVVDHTQLVSVGDRHTENGTGFQAVCGAISSLAGAKNLSKSIMSDPNFASALHCVVAYRYLDHNNIIRQGFDDDGDIGMGRRALQAIKDAELNNIIVLLCRFGNAKIGQRRFNLAQEAISSAVSKYMNK